MKLDNVTKPLAVELFDAIGQLEHVRFFSVKEVLERTDITPEQREIVQRLERELWRACSAADDALNVIDPDGELGG